MATGKITRFPINSSQRWRNRHGKRAVPCLVTSRWLQFSETSSKLEDGNYVFVNVMTQSEDGQAKKLCQLCISTENLREALDEVK